MSRCPTESRRDGAGGVLPTLTRPLQPVSRPAYRCAETRVIRGCHALLDGSVAVLSTWTVVYHLCLVLRLGVPWAVGLELLALAGWAELARRARRRAAPPHGSGPGAQAQDQPGVRTGASPGVVRTLVLTTVTTGGTAAVLVAVGVAWPLIAALWLTASGAGTALAVLRLRESPGHPDESRDRSCGVVVALVWATALAVLAMFTRWPNPDDLYYVNLSQWVVDNGTYPVRDTIFSDLVFPMSSWPPIASYDALAGTVARLAGVPAASVVYLIVPPLATFLAVLALWRLLRAWRVPAVALALSLALVFLLFDGGPGYAAPGNLFLIRIWQGKVILLCLMVPLLLVYALRYVERPTRARAGWLLAGGVAAVGLSTTAMFLVPLLALGGVAPLLLRRPGRALLGFAAMAAYPLAAGVLTLAVGGRSADDFDSRRLFRFEPEWFGQEIFREGPVALVAVVAVLAGVMLVPHRAARVTTGVLVTVTGVTFVPGFTQVAFDLTGLGPTLWRVSWVATIAALVGVLGARGATWFQQRHLRLAVPAVLAAVLAVSGLPVWSGAMGVSLDDSPQWKRGTDTLSGARAAMGAARPGDVVLAPEGVAVTIAVLTTEVKTVAPRDYFMDYLRDDPDFYYDERRLLLDFVAAEDYGADAAAIERALSVVGVDQVCLPPDAQRRTDLVRSLGFSDAAQATTVRCLTR